MSKEIKVNYGEIANQSASLYSRLQEEKRTLENDHKDVLMQIGRLDGMVNLATQNHTKVNEHKALTAGEVVLDLIQFTKNSSQVLEEKEKTIASSFKLVN